MGPVIPLMMLALAATPAGAQPSTDSEATLGSARLAQPFARADPCVPCCVATCCAPLLVLDGRINAATCSASADRGANVALVIGLLGAGVAGALGLGAGLSLIAVPTPGLDQNTKVAAVAAATVLGGCSGVCGGLTAGLVYGALEAAISLAEQTTGIDRRRGRRRRRFRRRLELPAPAATPDVTTRSGSDQTQADAFGCALVGLIRVLGGDFNLAEDEPRPPTPRSG